MAGHQTSLGEFQFGWNPFGMPAATAEPRPSALRSRAGHRRNGTFGCWAGSLCWTIGGTVRESCPDFLDSAKQLFGPDALDNAGAALTDVWLQQFALGAAERSETDGLVAFGRQHATLRRALQVALP